MEQLICFLLFLSVSLATDEHIERLVNDPGHLKPFGFGRPMLEVEQFDGFPHTRYFFENFVHDTRPLLMKNAAKLSKAFTKWTDEYFLSVEEPSGHTVTVELKKKENRTFGVEDYSFKKFVSVYNDSDIYMVNSIPPFIATDVMVPGPLQCEQMMEDMLVDSVMWFSSGGTKSVVHTDSVDNINCLFRGHKELWFIDPEKYGDKVDIDHPEGAYSSMDIDRVDFTKFPGMAEVEYYRVFIEPGDCLYIPYKWIHHVRSYGSNIAVNVWWDRYLGLELDLDQCPDHIDPELTMDKITLQGFGQAMMTIPAMRDHFLESTKYGSIDFMKTVGIMLGDTRPIEEFDPNKDYLKFIEKIFVLLDVDRNQKISQDEVEGAEDETWDEILAVMQNFDEMISVLEKKFAQDQRQKRDEL